MRRRHNVVTWVRADALTPAEHLSRF